MRKSTPTPLTPEEEREARALFRALPSDADRRKFIDLARTLNGNDAPAMIRAAAAIGPDVVRIIDNMLAEEGRAA